MGDDKLRRTINVNEIRTTVLRVIQEERENLFAVLKSDGKIS